MDVLTSHFPDDGETTTEISIRHNENTPMIPKSGEAGYTHEDDVSDMGDPISRLSLRDVPTISRGSPDEFDALLPLHRAFSGLTTSEPPSFPEPASVDDFLFELDEGIEPSLEPPLSDDTSSTKAPSLLRRVRRRFSPQESHLSDNFSTITPSVVAPSIRSSFSQKYAATLASAGAFCFEYLESRLYRTYSVRTFCESLFNSSRATDAEIASVKRYGDRNGILHRFLIFHIVRRDGRDFYLRMDRRKDPAVPLWVFGLQGLETRLAKDTVAISGRLEHLHDYTKDGEEAVMLFPTPAPLIATAQILYAVAAESQGYSLTKENCWFFASMIQDILIRNFGGQYQSGFLNHPKLVNRRRALILSLAYREFSREVDDGVDAVLKVTALIGDSALANTVKSCMDILREHHRSSYHNSLPRAFSLHQDAKELLVTLHRKLHEHLHGCCGFQGARVLSSPKGLLDALQGWIQTRHSASSPHSPLPHDEDDIKTIVATVADSATSSNVASQCSSFTYDPAKHELESSYLSLHARTLVLSALELLPACTALRTMPEMWRLHLNSGISDLHAEFGKRMSTPLIFVCRHWINLLGEADCADSQVIAALSRSIPTLCHWVAAMGIMGEVEQACRALKELHRWLDSKILDDSIKRTVYDLYRLILQSKNALAASSLSILGSGHPFIPSTVNPLHHPFTRDTAGQSRIVADSMDTSQAWSPQILRGHTRVSISIAFSPDGRRLASASADHTVHIRDAATGSILRKLEGHSDWVRSVAFSPDGRHLASASDDRNVHIWDAETGAILRELKGDGDWVMFVTFSPDGRQLASASHSYIVRIWDARTGAILRELKGHRGWVRSVMFSPNGRHLATASDDCTVRIWDAKTGAALRALKGHTGRVRSVAFSPDGRHLASASDDRTVHIWDAMTGVILRELKGHSHWVQSVAFSPDGRHLASASDDRTVRIWDAGTGAIFRELKGHTEPVVSVAFAPYGLHLASASYDFTVRIWDAAAKEPPQELKGHSKDVTSIAFSSDGHHLASISHDAMVCAWDVTSGSCIAQSTAYPGMVPCQLSLSTDGSMLTIQFEYGKIRHLHFPSLVNVAQPASLPPSTSPHPDTFSLPIHLDRNSLCLNRGDTTLRICWLPDNFEATTPVTQHKNLICIGGKCGMIAFINFDGHAILNL